jgi:hypothetical protein
LAILTALPLGGRSAAFQYLEGNASLRMTMGVLLSGQDRVERRLMVRVGRLYCRRVPTNLLLLSCHHKPQ